MNRLKGKMPIRNRIAIALVAMAFVFALAAVTPGCGGAPGGGELNLFGTEPTTLDPALCGDATSASYIVEIFSGLVSLNKELEVIPDIAQSWDISPSGERFQQYTENDDDTWPIYGDHKWIAQTFTAETDHAIAGVKLKLYKVARPGNVIVSIRATDADGHPTGNDLTWVRINLDGMRDGEPAVWKEVPLPKYDLTAGTKYAIVVRAPEGDAWNLVRWCYDHYEASYSGGNGEYGSSGGTVWTSHTAGDCMFQELVGVTYTFHLRDGVRFQDGEKVTASDFKYSLERAADPATQSPVAEAYLGDIVGVKQKLSAEVEEISGIRVIDDNTLEITIDAPKAYFLSKLTHPTAFVLDRENVESGANWTENPNGTGPFKLREWSEGQRIVLERNKRFYRGVAKLQRVTFYLIGNPMMMYEEGKIDITSVGTANIERVLDPTNPLNMELVIAPQLLVWYIGFNTSVPPFDDVKVRQAFCHAVDKNKIIEILLKSLVSSAAGILPPGMPGYNEQLEGLGYDVEGARELIAESSYQDISRLPPIVLSVGSPYLAVSSVDIAIAWMWQQNLGVDVEIEVLEWDNFLDELREQSLQTFETGWLADYPDPENFLDILFHSQSVENSTGYSNPDVDRLLESARAESDVDARLAIYQEVEEIIASDAPCLPLCFSRDYLLVKPYVKDFFAAPMVIPNLKDIRLED
jgi:ABC-type transport system substrate-binding protein